jgi:hypothetical protein
MSQILKARKLKRRRRQDKMRRKSRANQLAQGKAIAPPFNFVGVETGRFSASLVENPG